MTLALVTGSTGALGSAIVTALLDARYDLILYGRDLARLEALAQGRSQWSRLVWPWVCDLATATPAALRRDVTALEKLAGPIDLLVCAHGAPPCTTPTLALTPEDVAVIYRTDVLGTLHMAQAVGARMVGRCEGAMVFVSSAHGHQTYPARVGYAMAKASVCSLARALAVEWGPQNLRINSISPWQVEGQTRSSVVMAEEQAQMGEDTQALYCRRAPLGRLVTREDVAQTVVWLAQNQSMTGQDIRIDCGQSSSMWHRNFLEGEA